jgi:hypothetical protein
MKLITIKAKAELWQHHRNLRTRTSMLAQAVQIFFLERTPFKKIG